MNNHETYWISIILPCSKRSRLLQDLKERRESFSAHTSLGGLATNLLLFEGLHCNLRLELPHDLGICF